MKTKLLLLINLTFIKLLCLPIFLSGISNYLYAKEVDENPFELVQFQYSVKNPNIIVPAFKSNGEIYLSGKVSWEMVADSSVISVGEPLNLNPYPNNTQIRARLSYNGQIYILPFTIQGEGRYINRDPNDYVITTEQWSGTIVFKQSTIDPDLHNKNLWKIGNDIDQVNTPINGDGPNFVKFHLVLAANARLLVLSGAKAFNRLVFEDNAFLTVNEGVTIESTCNMWGGIWLNTPSGARFFGSPAKPIQINNANIGVFVRSEYTNKANPQFPFYGIDFDNVAPSNSEPFIQADWVTFNNNYYGIYLTTKLHNESFLSNCRFLCNPDKMLAPFHPQVINGFGLSKFKTEAGLVGFFAGKYSTTVTPDVNPIMVNAGLNYSSGLGFFDSLTVLRTVLLPSRGIVYPWHYSRLTTSSGNLESYRARISNNYFDNLVYGILSPGVQNISSRNTFRRIYNCAIRFIGSKQEGGQSAAYETVFESTLNNAYRGIQNQDIEILSSEPTIEVEKHFRYQMENLHKLWNNVNGFVVESVAPNNINVAEMGLSTGYINNPYEGEFSLENKVGIYVNYDAHSPYTNADKFASVRNNSILLTGLANSNPYYHPNSFGIIAGNSMELNNNVIAGFEYGIMTNESKKTLSRNKFLNRVAVYYRTDFSLGIGRGRQLLMSCNTFTDDIIPPTYAERIGILFDQHTRRHIILGDESLDDDFNSNGGFKAAGNVFPILPSIDRTVIDFYTDLSVEWESKPGYSGLKSLSSSELTYYHFTNEFVNNLFLTNQGINVRLQQVREYDFAYTANNPPPYPPGAVEICQTSSFPVIYFPLPFGQKAPDDNRAISIGIQREKAIEGLSNAIPNFFGSQDECSGKIITEQLIKSLPQGTYFFSIKGRPIKLLLL